MQENEKSLIIKKDNMFLLDTQVSKLLAKLERDIKILKEQQDLIKESVLKAMRTEGLLKIETDEVTINFIEASERETFDTKKFKEDQPDEYDKYVKLSPVKASVRIKVKNNG